MFTSFIRFLGVLVIVALLSPAAMLAAPGAQGETIHVVQWGETLSLIAERYGVTVEALMDANGLTDPNFVYVGQRLVVPAPGGSAAGGRHVVAAGETLTTIAFRYGTTVSALASANGLSDSDMIYVGQVLYVPGGAPSGPMPAAGGCAATYTVQWGDTLSGIAWQHLITVNDLRQANSLYSDFIYQGQRLCIPLGGVAGEPLMPPPGGPSGPMPGGLPMEPPQQVYYTVRPGDTLMAIASRFGVSQAAIVRANNLSNPNFLYTGQRLVIPGAAAQPSSRPRLNLRPAKLAFARWDGHKHDLYIANVDGSDEQLLMERAAGPSWSPDGRRLSIFGEEGVDRQMLGGTSIVFEGISDGVIIASVPGWPGDPSQLNLVQIKREGSARATAWAPNGQMIAWDARPGGDYRIYFHGFEGTEFEAQSAIEIPGEQPDWSPDSNYLVYRSGREGKQGLWISDRFDSFAQRITDDGSDSFPRWSPDGRWIAFQREADGNVDIYLMPAPGPGRPGPGPDGPPGGGQIHRLTNAPGADTLPAWTADGHILFRSTRTGSWAIFVMKDDGGDQQPLIPNADPGPDWTFGRMDVHALN